MLCVSAPPRENRLGNIPLIRDGPKMIVKTGLDEPGISTVNRKSHLGNLILRKLGYRMAGGADDLKRFEL
jgi:hypothetical protein